MNGAGVVANRTTGENLGICGRFLVLRAVLREMPQLSKFETTGASEEIIHLSQLWATAPFVRSMSRLVSPASVETIALQFQSNLLVLTLAPAFLASPETLARPLSALLEILQDLGQLWFFERGVLRDARHVDPLTIMVLGFSS